MGLFVASEANQAAQWHRELLKPLNDSGALLAARLVEASHIDVNQRIFVVTQPKGPMNHKGISCFRQKGECARYAAQYVHLRDAYDSMRDWECTNGNGAAFSFVLRVRVDVIYFPDFQMKAEWLLRLPEATIAVNAKEFGPPDRWIDREPSMWPYGMCDQMVLGRRREMDLYFRLTRDAKPLAETRRRGRDGGRAGIEAVIADFMIKAGITVVAIDVQLARPPRGIPWIIEPCLNCFEPESGGARLGGVGEEMRPVRAAAEEEGRNADGEGRSAATGGGGVGGGAQPGKAAKKKKDDSLLSPIFGEHLINKKKRPRVKAQAKEALCLSARKHLRERKKINSLFQKSIKIS